MVHVTHLMTLLTAFLAVAVAPVMSLTYWVDKSCLEYPAGPGKTANLRDGRVFYEAFRMARIAGRRMDKLNLKGKGRNLELARAYNYIFTDDPSKSRTIRRGLAWRRKYGGEGFDTVKNVVKGKVCFSFLSFLILPRALVSTTVQKIKERLTSENRNCRHPQQHRQRLGRDLGACWL